MRAKDDTSAQEKVVQKIQRRDISQNSWAKAANPAPFGRDVSGAPLNDPTPDTMVDPATGDVVSAPAVGQSALLDQFTVTKPDVEDGVSGHIDGPNQAVAGSTITYNVCVRNGSAYPLNGVQIVINLPDGAAFAGTAIDTLTVHGSQVVATLGRIGIAGTQSAQVNGTLASSLAAQTKLKASAVPRSSTALPVSSNQAPTLITQ